MLAGNYFNSTAEDSFAFLLRFFILAYTSGVAAGRCEVHESQGTEATAVWSVVAGLCLIETEAAGADMAEQRAAEVMQDDDGEDHKAVVKDGAAERETTQPTVMMTTSAENIGMIVFTFFT